MDYLFKKITESIKNSNKVIIMTHKHPDLDGIGSALAMHEIVKTLKKDCYIVLPHEKLNSSLDKSIKILEKNKINVNFIDPKEVAKLISDKNLLIILDTGKPILVENQKLLEMPNIIVIDHHPMSSVHITNTIVEYIDETKSSVIEIMTEYLRHLNIKINPIILTILLTGLEIDTNCYHFKTTEKTFNAAAFLTKNGANINLKNEILKMPKAAIIRINEHIKQSRFIKDGFIVCDIGALNKMVYLAIIADELLKLENVEAAFAIGKLKDGNIRISARSMGNVSVNEIMKALGGGGHITAAAAEIKNKTTEEVIEMIKNIITEE